MHIVVVDDDFACVCRGTLHIPGSYSYFHRSRQCGLPYIALAWPSWLAHFWTDVPMVSDLLFNCTGSVVVEMVRYSYGILTWDWYNYNIATTNLSIPGVLTLAKNVTLKLCNIIYQVWIRCISVLHDTDAIHQVSGLVKLHQAISSERARGSGHIHRVYNRYFAIPSATRL